MVYLRFADDILVFATSSQQTAYMLDELVVALADVGLILYENKTKLLITTPRGLNVAVVDRAGCHKWFGCILSGNNRGSHRFDIEYHLQAVSKALFASKAFFANRNIVCNMALSLVKRLHFFDKIVTPVACFAAGHKKITKHIWKRWMFIFAACFDLLLATPTKRTT